MLALTTLFSALVASSIASDNTCAHDFSQCDGENWPHAVCCINAAFECTYVNEYLSLCLATPVQVEYDPLNPNGLSPTFSTQNENGTLTFEVNDVSNTTAVPNTTNSESIGTRRRLRGESTSSLLDAEQNTSTSITASTAQNSTEEYSTTKQPEPSTSGSKTSFAPRQNESSIIVQYPDLTPYTTTIVPETTEPASQTSTAPPGNFTTPTTSTEPPISPGTSNAPSPVLGYEDQCGGLDYNGPTECGEGLECTMSNLYYWYCEFLPADSSVVPLWEQCGGADYTGNTLCQPGTICTAQSTWYSQCVPKQD